MAETGATAADAGGTAAAAAAPAGIPDRGPAAFAAELIGTFVLVFSITMVVVNYKPAPIEATQGAPTFQPFQDFAVIGLVHVLALFFLIQTLAVMSGAHFNPAVTVAMTVVRQIKPVDSAIYILLQLIGGVVGALTTRALIPDDVGDKVNWGATNLSPNLDTIHGMGAEALGTFFLVWAIMGVAVNPTAIKDWSGLVIGGTLGFAVMIIAPLTGAGFNPARSLGPAIVAESFDGVGKWLLLYVLAPLIGALIAVFLYSFLMVMQGKKGRGGAEPVG